MLEGRVPAWRDEPEAEDHQLGGAGDAAHTPVQVYGYDRSICKRTKPEYENIFPVWRNTPA